MTFTTLTFFIFSALVFAVYWRLSSLRLQNVCLLCASLVFYGWWDPRFCAMMIGACTVDFYVARQLDRTSWLAGRRMLLAVSMGMNLGILGFFKYCNFFVDSVASAASALGWTIHPWTLQILLPVGISFYTFQTMCYVIDVYRRELKASQNLVEYLAFISFFPQLVAGPIERASHMLAQFQQPRRFDEVAAISGCRLMLWGFLKKLVLADGLAQIADAAFWNPQAATGPQLLIGTLAFAVQIYCDFSAYSDIAAGVARLFGFQLMRNFAYPYFSQSVSEFWRRWHISLSSWFRDYVFVPLGGSRHGAFVLARNLVLTFLISGLWHGAAWKFVIWGGLMGVAVAIESLVFRSPKRSGQELPGGANGIPNVSTLARMAWVWLVICLGWVFFRANTLDDALFAVMKMSTGVWNPAEWLTYRTVFPTSKASESAALAVVFFLVEWSQRAEWSPLQILERWPLGARWFAYTAILWLILLTAPNRDAQFIYFQF